MYPLLTTFLVRLNTFLRAFLDHFKTIFSPFDGAMIAEAARETAAGITHQTAAQHATSAANVVTARNYQSAEKATHLAQDAKLRVRV